MSSKELTKQVYQSLVFLAEAYGAEKVTPERLKFYSELLVGELTPEELKASIKNIIFKCKFFPSIAEIIEIVRPSVDDQANEIAGEILNSIRNFGTPEVKEAMAFLGPEKWDVVTRFGGWSILSKLEYDQMNTARAQLRELAKGCVRSKVRTTEINKSQIECSPGLKKLKLESL